MVQTAAITMDSVDAPPPGGHRVIARTRARTGCAATCRQPPRGHARRSTTCHQRPPRPRRRALCQRRRRARRRVRRGPPATPVVVGNGSTTAPLELPPSGGRAVAEPPVDATPPRCVDRGAPPPPRWPDLSRRTEPQWFIAGPGRPPPKASTLQQIHPTNHRTTPPRSHGRRFDGSHNGPDQLPSTTFRSTGSGQPATFGAGHHPLAERTEPEPTRSSQDRPPPRDRIDLPPERQTERQSRGEPIAQNETRPRDQLTGHSTSELDDRACGGSPGPTHEQHGQTMASTIGQASHPGGNRTIRRQ
ncbi:hypothetical protein CLV40_101240 [Actinokineospora auranticolor]|uniref:Uncharacterized protein n=1 Tax=Actinokineospora auranticolor TaxID=155976 RepID=A0A2S6H0Q2_9PSEU|nr:hypothetical protein CLV40_101240 [Actinokineospora auranticolor]